MNNMEIAGFWNKSKKKLQDGLRYLISSSITLFLFFILIRLFEIFSTWKLISKQSMRIELLSRAFLYDIIMFLEVTALVGILFLVVTLFLNKTSKVLLNGLFIVVILIYIMLVAYFSKTLIPLGSDLFGYSMFEINETVRSAGGFNPLYLIYLAAFLAVVIFLLIMIRRIPLHKRIITYSAALLVFSILFGEQINPEPKSFANTSEYFLAVNKLQFFVSKSYKYFFDKETELPLSNYYIDSDTEGNTFKYIDSNYPFLHEEKTVDVLSNFFDSTATKPNIVLIITESLGRGYSGEKATLGSFTPFLDSLAKQSLYWENFLSTGGRTFAALPSLLGSLPFAEKGFLEMGQNMPAHVSLIKYLKKYGYKVNFYYGGNSRFDMMDQFLRRQNVDLIIDENNFGSGYKKMPSSGSGFSWGYGDIELFDRSFKVINSNKNENQFNILLTISMHSPFRVENQDIYRQKFDEIYYKLRLDSDSMDKLKSYKDILSCVLYTDDAFRQFFNEYKKHDEFKNTIFIITGDHRMPEIPIISQIDRFYVPLIIYSPMLKRTAKFSSVSSHFDLTPTLASFLAKRYGMEKINTSSFIGSGLDTSRQFRNVHSYPLMRNKNELLDYLYLDYFYSDKILYKVVDNMVIVPIEDNVMKEKIDYEFRDFKKRNENMVRTKKIIPDSLYRKF